jgi:hypothetical protein
VQHNKIVTYFLYTILGGCHLCFNLKEISVISMMDDKTISFVSVVYIRIGALKLRIMKINILVLNEYHKGFE